MPEPVPPDLSYVSVCMTFRSTFVEIHSSRDSAVEPYCRSDVPLLKLMDSLTWGSLASFAGKHCLHVEYVDNCWIRVAVDNVQLSKFLTNAAGLKDESQLATEVPLGKWFVINEEEF